MRALKDVFRRKLRTSLTVFGISIGVFTVTVLGAFAEKAFVTSEFAYGYFETRVVVADAKDATGVGFSSGNRPLSMRKIDEIKRLPGVKDVAPQVTLMLDPNQPVTGSTPSMLLGGFMGTDKNPEPWRFTKGHGFSESETGVAVVGRDIVKQLRAAVGETITAYGKKFKVVGILDSTLTLLDQSVMISLRDARELYVASLPKPIQKTIDKDDIATNFIVSARPGQKNQPLANLINRKVIGVKATGVEDIKDYLSQMVLIVSAIIVGVGMIALLIGGLSVVNTMTMSVSERTREIGIKRAMGASTGRIVREILTEAALISSLGGLIGIAVGVLSVLGLNAAMATSAGTVIFMLTPRLVLGAELFGLLLGITAGLLPAWRAARMNPVAALGYEY